MAVSSEGPEQLQDDVGACQGTGCSVSSPALPEYTLTLQEDVSISSFEFVLQFLYHCPSLHLCWDNVLGVAAASQYMEALNLLEQCRPSCTATQESRAMWQRCMSGRPGVSRGRHLRYAD